MWGHFASKKTAAKLFNHVQHVQATVNISKREAMPLQPILEINEVGRRIVSDGCHPRSGKTVTLRLSGGCHPTERSWMEVGRVSKVTSLACTTTPCPTAGWPPVTWKGSGAHVPLSVQAKPLEPLLAATPDCASDPLAGPAGRRVPILQYFYFYFLFFIYLKSKTVKII
ncbi:unnamed protein product [Spirodela intermedia]|uniref:Uncharacterized protein n=1 Tax=Spirodela intermedia TaxID=51605 RepID=A0ABN7EB55_SPIIN|nr:unnamed protein product [Spirodela intermedia]